jgi:hypothetical protein
MNPSRIETLTNPPLCGHIVYSYTSEAQLVEAVCLFAHAGLQKGESVRLVMTETHRQAVRQQLEVEGFNLNQLESFGQLVCVDAADLLATFMTDGLIDEYRFKTTVGDMIVMARTAGGSRRTVRIFGEMVDLIWNSYPTATYRLEQLWNQVIDVHGVQLLCAYSLTKANRIGLTPSLLACHSHAV